MEEDLFVPTKIQKENVYAEGFGKCEFKRTVKLALSGLVLGLIVGLWLFNNSMQSIIISTIAGGFVFAAIGYFFNVRSGYKNISIWEFCADAIKSSKGQKLYLYVKEKEW